MPVPRDRAAAKGQDKVDTRNSLKTVDFQMVCSIRTTGTPQVLEVSGMTGIVDLVLEAASLSSLLSAIRVESMSSNWPLLSNKCTAYKAVT
jgi:hypothetical protein